MGSTPGEPPLRCLPGGKMVEELTTKTFPRPPERTGSGQERLRDDNLKDSPELPQRSRLMKKSELSIPLGGCQQLSAASALTSAMQPRRSNANLIYADSGLLSADCLF